MTKHELAPAKLDTLFSDLNTKFSKHIFNNWGETGTRHKMMTFRNSKKKYHRGYVVDA